MLTDRCSSELKALKSCLNARMVCPCEATSGASPCCARSTTWEFWTRQIFGGNQHLFLALAQRRAKPLLDALHALAPLPPSAQWANFLRNPDELDLARLSQDDRELVYREFAPDPDMRLYDRSLGGSPS
jgi:hypothetical protein